MILLDRLEVLIVSASSYFLSASALSCRIFKNAVLHFNIACQKISIVPGLILEENRGENENKVDAEIINNFESIRLKLFAHSSPIP